MSLQSGACHTNATDDTIHSSFNTLLDNARTDVILHNTVFDIASLFSGNIMRIIRMNQHHTDKDGRPTIDTQDCSDSVFRMMMFFKNFLRFPIVKVDFDSDNTFFYTRKSGVVTYLIEQGIDAHHICKNREYAVFSILRQVNHGTAVEEYTYEQVEEVRQCVSLLYSHNVGLDLAIIFCTLNLVRRMHAKLTV